MEKETGGLDKIKKCGIRDKGRWDR